MASETLNPVKRERAESGGDLLASLTKEAQHLKEKLEEEKRKLYDADCRLNLRCLLMTFGIGEHTKLFSRLNCFGAALVSFVHCFVLAVSF